jgi:SagB-type dehydrogenase family enzyme
VRRAKSPVEPLRYRRAPHLVCYWHNRRLVLHDYARGARTIATPLVVDVLDGLATWQPIDEIFHRLEGVAPALVEDLVRVLLRRGLLERSDRRSAPKSDALDEWGSWNPQASFFHLATKDVRYWPRDDVAVYERERALTDPPPPAAVSSRPRDGAVWKLPPPPLQGVLPHTLRQRRTWRRFGRGTLSLDRLATLLGLTWGVQAEVGNMVLKTSPSGGARHSIEAYLVSRRVKDLPKGIYHYDSRGHALVRVRDGLGPGGIEAYLPQQPWYDDASAVIFMTAVFGRVQWRYPFARAYRTVLAEAGHHCQTFCLLATWLELAPFCTMALADSRIERDLGIDGVSESVLYAAGVGLRPPGVTWAPWAGTSRLPSRRDVVPGRDMSGLRGNPR